jgi:hypothetical protein
MEAIVDYWPYLLTAVVVLAISSYVIWKYSKSTETFTSYKLPNTEEYVVTEKDKECAYLNMAISTAKFALKQYNDPEKNKEYVEGFSNQGDLDKHNEGKQHYEELLKSYTKQQKVIGCDYYEAMVAEAMTNPAPKS